MTQHEYGDYVLFDDYDRLRAELTEARQQLKGASEQEPVAWLYQTTFQPGFEEVSFAPDMHRGVETIVRHPLYAAPVPQPAVPEAVAKDAARYRWMREDMKNLWGDDVLEIIGESGKRFDAAIDAAILATKEDRSNG